MKTEGEIISGRKAKWYRSLQILRGATSIYRRMVSLLKLSGNEKILDIGCGPGAVLFLLREKHGSSLDLYGIDPSEDMIEIAQRENGRRNSKVELSVGIGEDIGFEDHKFDWVVSSLTFHHLPRNAQREVAGEILRVLKPSGRVLVSDWGRPRNLLGRMVGLAVKRHAHTTDNLQGSVVQVLREARFRQVTVLDTQFGIIEHVAGAK